MKMNLDYLDRVRRMASLFTTRKTSDLLEGDFSSLQHGRSLDFDDLREYRYGDEISDIDWKSSSRTGKILVRRYFADKKHNAVFVCDTGTKMTGDTPAGESKEHLALMTFGMTAYLLDKQGINYAIAHSGANGDTVSNFLSGAAHLERLLAGYENALESGEPVHSLNELLNNVSAAYSKHMVMIVITDGEGLASIDERLVRRMIYHNDVYIFKIEDAFLTTADVFDLEANRFEDSYLSSDRILREEERKLRQSMENAAEKRMTPYRVFFKSISKEEEIVDALVELFRKRKGA